MNICQACPQEFIKQRMGQRVCSPRCAMRLLKAVKAADRQETKRRKEALKPRKEWLSDTQDEINRYVRLRDIAAGHGCIDCGKPFEPGRPGGSVDAGHYLSRGSAPHLRFDERNIFAQRKNCNRPGGATREAFRAGVVARIGEEAVAALECDQSTPKWTIDELKAIKTKYRAMWRAIEKEN